MFFCVISYELGSEEMGASKNKSQTTLWIYLYRCSKLGPRSVWVKQSDCVLEELTRTICDKAIRHRMSKAFIDHSPIKSPKLYETPSEKTMTCVKDMVDLLVSAHPELYSEITFKLNVPIQEERTVCRTYRSVFLIYCPATRFTKGSWNPGVKI